MKIISERERIENVSYSLFFERKDCHGAGYAPRCDEHGNVDLNKMHPVSRSMWDEIQKRIDLINSNKDEEFFAPVVQTYKSAYWQPAIGLCGCGEEVYLDGFTNTCECGCDYNSSGQLLAPREQWGEETGESLPDIMRIP